MKARIIDGKIAEIFTPVSGFSVEECFHPSVLGQSFDVADDVQVGWVQQEDGSFAAPVVVTLAETPAETPTEAPSTTPVVAPAETPTDPTA